MTVEQLAPIDWSKTAFVANFSRGEQDRAMRQLARGHRLIEAPTIVGTPEGIAVGVPPTNRPGGVLELLRVLVPSAGWQLWISGTPIPTEMFELPCEVAPLVPEAIIDETGAADWIATAAVNTALDKIEAARDVLATLLDHALKNDDADVSRGADDNELADRRLEILRSICSLERIAAELAGPQ